MKEIALIGKYGKGKFAIVDDKDYDNLCAFSWFMSAKGYAIRTGRKGEDSTVYMHRSILGKKDGFVSDHINCNRLDNRNRNLRLATLSENQYNRKRTENNKSGLKGVYRNKGMWQAQIRSKNTHYYLGRYEDQLEAALVYDAAAFDLHGQFASLNGQL